jgi:hypothetical protein
MPLLLLKLFRFTLFPAIIVCFFVYSSSAQQKDSVAFAHDSTIVIEKKKDSTIKKRVFSPRAAAIRSAILPGLGQIYNKKYWKLPIVYGALGVTAYIFFDNLKTYREYRFAYKARILASTSPYDSTLYNQLKPEYKLYQPASIRTARDEFRRYIDYSTLFFILFWGLNVVDATVDAHLKGFDVSPDLTLKIKPYIPTANTFGISLVLTTKNKHSR